MPTASLVIIGDEILSGKFPEENAPYLIGRLRALGCDLRRVTVIPDEIEAIAREVGGDAERFDWVFTSGGVGPTHDDVTLDGVAAAFGVGLEERPELLALIDRFGLPHNHGTHRMASAPIGAELVDDAAFSFPIVRMRNVYVLPGVPKLFRNKFEVLAPRFAGAEVRVARVYTDEQEWDLEARLSAVAARYPQLALGSYPRFGEGPFRVILTVEGRDLAAVDAAVAELRAAVREVRLPAP